MRDTLDGVFSALLDEAYDWGAGLLKWGGDALLLLFDGPDHERRALPAPAGRCSGRSTASAGSGHGRDGDAPHVDRDRDRERFDFFTDRKRPPRAADRRPGATETVTIEAIADAGEIGISHGAGRAARPACVGPPKEQALLLVAPPEVDRHRAPDVGYVGGIDIASCIPIATRAHVLLKQSEPEHRTITAAFIDMMDTDDLLAALGPTRLGEALDERICAIQEAALRFEVPFYETDVGQGERQGAADRRRPVEHGPRRGADAAGAAGDHGAARA